MINGLDPSEPNTDVTKISFLQDDMETISKSWEVLSNQLLDGIDSAFRVPKEYFYNPENSQYHPTRLPVDFEESYKRFFEAWLRQTDKGEVADDTRLHSET